MPILQVCSTCCSCKGLGCVITRSNVSLIRQMRFCCRDEKPTLLSGSHATRSKRHMWQWQSAHRYVFSCVTFFGGPPVMLMRRVYCCIVEVCSASIQPLLAHWSLQVSWCLGCPASTVRPTVRCASTAKVLATCSPKNCKMPWSGLV